AELLGVSEEAAEAFEITFRLTQLQVFGRQLDDFAVQVEVLIDRATHVEVAVVHVGGRLPDPVHGLRHGRENRHHRALEHCARLADVARPRAQAHQHEEQGKNDDEQERRSAGDYVYGYCHVRFTT